MRPQGVFSVRAAGRQTAPRKLLLEAANGGGLSGADSKPPLGVQSFRAEKNELKSRSPTIAGSRLSDRPLQVQATATGARAPDTTWGGMS